MNDEFTDLWADALDELNDTLGEEFTFRGATWTGVINDLEYTSAFGTDALQPKLGNIIIIPITSLDSAPAVGELLLVRGKRAKIETVKTDEVCYEIVCVTSDK